MMKHKPGPTADDFWVLHAIEAELSEPRFREISVGPTLASLIFMEILGRPDDWSLPQRWMNRARWLRYWLRPQFARPPAAEDILQGRIIVTRLDNDSRLRDLMMPVVSELGAEECLILCARDDSPPQLPGGLQGIAWNAALHCEPKAWRSDFGRCWPQWKAKLARLCGRFGLQEGALEALSLQLLLSTQNIAGCLAFLRKCRPAAIVTEFDRNSLWSALILAGRALGIPTFGLVHGVADKHGNPMVPVLADKLFAWSENYRRRFIAAGEDPQKIVVGGCPRLTRELRATPAAARAKLGLPVDRPAVMLGTAPYRPEVCLADAEAFCAAADKLEGISAFVRLHPSQSAGFYESIARRHPRVAFHENGYATLDESLAAANVVVMLDSGIGGDALVKGRMVVILNTCREPLHHGQDLIDEAECPRAETAGELAAILQRLLFDEEARRVQSAAAERFVFGHCEFFGQDSAGRIADCIRRHIMQDAARPTPHPCHNAETIS